MENKLRDLETFFLALADKTRLRILNLMGEDEICVGHLVEVLNESQPKVSRHLAYLRSAGLVSVRRDGKWMHYRIEEPENPAAAEALNDLLAWMGTQEQMRKERKKLEAIGGITKTKTTVTKKKTAPAQPPLKSVAKRPVKTKAEETFYEEEPPVETAEFEEEIYLLQEQFIEQEERAAMPPFQREELETFLL